MNQPMYHQQPVIGPKTVVLYRTSKYGFGFTLRHFIVYPPESPAERNISGILNITQPMDTVFVKDVRINGPAHIGGLRPGDRLLSVNSMPVAGTPYANVVRAIQQTPTVLKLIVVPKDCDILQTLFSESAHSPESNQRPCIYANAQDISFNVQSNVKHVPIQLPNMAMDNNGVDISNVLRINPHAKYLNETGHRHSFNETIYSEPYGGRFVAGQRFESNNYEQSNQLCESASASNLYCNNGMLMKGTHSTYFFPQNASHRDTFGMTSMSSTSNGLHTTSATNSTRSSVYSDKTILNQQTTPPTTPCSIADEPTNKLTNSNNLMALNASGSQSNLSLTPNNHNADAQMKHTNPVDQSSSIAESICDQKSENNEIATVMRRSKNSNLNSIERTVRRISYLKATANDISLRATDNQPKSDENKKDKPILSEELQMLEQFFKRNSTEVKVTEADLEAKFNMKIAYIQNEKPSIRQWHRILAKLYDDSLFICILQNDSEEATQISGLLNLYKFHVLKSIYTKRKYVFKLSNVSDVKPASPSLASLDKQKTEFLIQADDQNSFDLWKRKLDKLTRLSIDCNEQKLQLPPKEKINGVAAILDKELSTSKTRTWKGLVARQLRRIHGQGPSSPNSTNTSIELPNVASIGVPLALCPISDKNKYVPLILARCTDIVETRGLAIIGIYRIPGNTAAISALTELVNKGFDEQTLNDPRWDDVNVVSSLLKLFLRRLPEALIPNDMYKQFLDADNQTGTKRLIVLKELIDSIPIQFYESLKHLMHHLFLVSQNCQINLMEPKNLAIIFGPSVVRASNDTLETVVKDMKHQCRIVEALVSNYEYFFENGEMPKVCEQPEQMCDAPKSQTNLLLDNVSKIESYSDQMDKNRFVFKIVQAARNRKSKKKQSTTLSSMASDTMSMDSSSTSTEYRDSLTPKVENLTDVDGMQSGLSADDSADLFCEDSGSMSLATLIPALEDKFYALHNGSFDSEQNRVENVDINDSSSSILRNHQLISLQPLTIGDESIPYADDSPDQQTLPAINDKPIEQTHNYSFTSIRNKPWNPSNSNRLIGTYRTTEAIDTKSINSISSDDNETDESNTSDHETNQTIRINSDVIREMNRILTTLERKATKLNRSLSLNTKYHHNECCCNNGHILSNSNHSSCRSIATNRYSLTKDEKTDKNINLAKRRQIQDNNQKTKRYTNRPIKRRHTVGGIHYGYNNKSHPMESTQTR